MQDKPLPKGTAILHYFVISSNSLKSFFQHSLLIDIIYKFIVIPDFGIARLVKIEI